MENTDKHCGSENLIRVVRVICVDCGFVLSEEKVCLDGQKKEKQEENTD